MYKNITIIIAYEITYKIACDNFNRFNRSLQYSDNRNSKKMLKYMRKDPQKNKQPQVQLTSHDTGASRDKCHVILTGLPKGLCGFKTWQIF